MQDWLQKIFQHKIKYDESMDKKIDLSFKFEPFSPLAFLNLILIKNKNQLEPMFYFMF
jgi:hypothetical protein